MLAITIRSSSVFITVVPWDFTVFLGMWVSPYFQSPTPTPEKNNQLQNAPFLMKMYAYYRTSIANNSPKEPALLQSTFTSGTLQVAKVYEASAHD